MNILEIVLSIIVALSSIVIAFGVIAAFKQAKAARQALTAQVVMKLSEDWRNPQLYSAITYIHRLREKWKSCSVKDWDQCAEKWVKEHAGMSSDSSDSGETRLWQEWVMRRTASQFIAKMGLMVESGYLSAETLFGVIPEMGRLLVVLIPIECAIQKHWADREQKPLAGWDLPIAKWEFNTLLSRYKAWYEGRDRKEGKYELNPIDWSIVLSATGK